MIAEKTLKIYRQPSGNPDYPEIRLSGKWLQDNGFDVGDYIRVAYGVNEIVIKKICGGDEYEQEQTRDEA